MAKKWYQYLVTQDEAAARADEAVDAPTVDESAAPAPPSTAAAAPTDGPPPSASSLPSFDEIYAAAQIAVPVHGYTILKVAEMLRSEHIATLPAEVKAKSVRLALDAAAVPLDAVVQDAIQRDRALDAFERTQDRTLRALEQRVKADAQRWQQEIEALIAERQAKIRAADEALARETAAVRQWRERKAAEEARIADAVGHFLSENPITIGQGGEQSSSKA